MEYLSTLSKHSQAVNVVRFAPKGMHISQSTPAQSLASKSNQTQEKLSPQLATMEMSYYGFQPKPIIRKLRLERMDWRIKRLGESNICADHPEQKYTI